MGSELSSLSSCCGGRRNSEKNKEEDERRFAILIEVRSSRSENTAIPDANGRQVSPLLALELPEFSSPTSSEVEDLELKSEAKTANPLKRAYESCMSTKWLNCTSTPFWKRDHDKSERRSAVKGVPWRVKTNLFGEDLHSTQVSKPSADQAAVHAEDREQCQRSRQPNDGVCLLQSGPKPNQFSGTYEASHANCKGLLPTGDAFGNANTEGVECDDVSESESFYSCDSFTSRNRAEIEPGHRVFSRCGQGHADVKSGGKSADGPEDAARRYRFHGTGDWDGALQDDVFAPDPRDRNANSFGVGQRKSPKQPSFGELERDFGAFVQKTRLKKLSKRQKAKKKIPE